MDNSVTTEQIGILEGYDSGGKWAEIIIDGKEYSMKYGELINLSCYIPGYIWDQRNEETVDEIRSILPDWPNGARVKHLNGKIVAIWIPTKNVWVRQKGS